MSQAFPGTTQDVFVSASIGLSLFPDDSKSAVELTRHADAAMYSAKKLGRNNYQFFTHALNEEAHERMMLEAGLRQALKRDELYLVYQPKIDLESREVIGAEALIRWNHPKLGLVAPARFIPVAEESGLVGEIGEWVLRTACAQIRTWQGMNLFPQIAVNVSARQFHQYDLSRLISAVIREAQIPPESLEIELTESAVMHDAESSIVTLERVKQLGVRIAIDDFGTGYSALAYLKKLPVDTLKIDREFIRDVPGDEDDVSIVKSIIALAKSMKIDVLAEGVETRQQLDFLKNEGCSFIQGHYLSEPKPASEIPGLTGYPSDETKGQKGIHLIVSK